ncbi:MAG: electron transport complex subunit E [Coriobacteriales bacterium]|jgi:electron transport complex protein RnfE|nr:electron transport complex subunit E [Coriobacteriales bacterium]MDO5708816.1 electron transport complex subunit E [Coriobacteriales bacterium]
MAQENLLTQEAPTLSQTMRRGLLEENPSLRQMLGLCPTLAVTTAVTNGIGMGLATTFVLVCSGVVVSLLRKVIPSTVRIPAFITIIASFVTLVMMLTKAYLPALDEALGIYLPLIVVNCIVLGRAEMFASKHGPALAAADGLGMGLGFTASLTAMSAVREVLGNGTFLGVQVLPSFLQPMVIMVMPAGGFAVLGVLLAISVWMEEHPRHRHKVLRKSSAPAASLCAACPIKCGIGDPTNEACAKDEFVEMLEAAYAAARKEAEERDK